MGAIALSALWLTLAAEPATREQANELAAELAADLSSDRADQFLRWFAEEMPGRGEFAANIEAMLRAAEVATTLEIRTFRAVGQGFVVEIDWYLEMRRREGGLLSTQRRREFVTLEAVKPGKRWRVVKLEPLSFFAAPSPAQ